MPAFALPAIALARRFWPIIWPILLALAVLAALWGWGNSRYNDGVATERAAWEREATRLRTIAAEAALQRLEAVTEANTAAAASRVALDALALETRTKARDYYAADPRRNRACLDAGRLRAIAEADAAAQAAAAAR